MSGAFHRLDVEEESVVIPSLQLIDFVGLGSWEYPSRSAFPADEVPLESFSHGQGKWFGVRRPHQPPLHHISVVPRRLPRERLASNGEPCVQGA